MTKKNYEFVAYILFVHRNNFKNKRKFRSIIRDFANIFLQDNHRFNEALFIEACHSSDFWDNKYKPDIITHQEELEM